MYGKPVRTWHANSTSRSIGAEIERAQGPDLDVAVLGRGARGGAPWRKGGWMREGAAVWRADRKNMQSRPSCAFRSEGRIASVKTFSPPRARHLPRTVRPAVRPKTSHAPCAPRATCPASLTHRVPRRAPRRAPQHLPRTARPNAGQPATHGRRHATTTATRRDGGRRRASRTASAPRTAQPRPPAAARSTTAATAPARKRRRQAWRAAR